MQRSKRSRGLHTHHYATTQPEQAPTEIHQPESGPETDPKLLSVPVVLAVGDVELHVAVEAEVSIQPHGLHADLVQDSEQHLLGGHGSVEDAQALLVGHARVGPCLDEGVTEHGAASNVGQQQSCGNNTRQRNVFLVSCKNDKVASC